MSKGLPKILLLDSNALIHRSFHAIPPLTTPKGEQVNAVYGFANALLKAIKDEKPDYVVACFDVGKDTFRNKIFDGYKAHRKETDHALTLQIPRVKEIVEVLNIPLFAQKGVEADDLVGSLAHIANQKGIEAVIVTGDNDALQLVGDMVSVYSLRRGVTDTLTYDRKAVKEKVGVFPEQIIDYKALAGDSSDNIPGAPGIGPKTACELLEKYKTLDGIYQHLDELKERPQNILRDNKKQVLMSKELAEIKKDLKIDLDLKEADVKNFDFSKVVGLFHELDFKSLLTKLPAGTKGSQGSLFGSGTEEETIEVTPQLPYEAVKDEKRWQEIREILLDQEMLVIDTETTDLDGELIGVAFAWNKDDSAYLPLAPAYPGGLPLEKIRDGINEVLSDTDIKKIGHNIKYDLGALRKAGLLTKGVWFDTMIASQLVNSQLFSHRLDDLAFSELGFKKISITQLIGKKKDESMATVPLEKLAAYSCEDALITWRLFEHLRKDVEEKSVKKVFYEIEMPLLPVLEEMEFHGVKVDRPYLKELEGQLQAKLKKIEAAVHEAAGTTFNVASPGQLQGVLFEKLNLPVVGIKKNKNGYSTDADSLAKLKDKHPIIEHVLEYREVAKLLNTYVETLPALLDKNDRVHTTFQQIGAATGRLASQYPNLQNIPIRTELGNKVRQAFVADKGKVLLGADYSQAELRVLAHISEDPQLIEAFHNATDFHAAVAARLGVDRRAAKAINFGIIYGLGANALARDLQVKTEVAREFIDKYFATFPGVAQFIEKMKRQAREQGYVETIYGRKRYLPDIQSPNMMLRSAAERMAVNMPNQGTVADLMKLSMIKLQEELPKEAKMLLQIHDELLFEVEKGAEEKVSHAVKEVMGSIATLKVPLIVETKTGLNWAQMKPL